MSGYLETSICFGSQPSFVERAKREYDSALLSECRAPRGKILVVTAPIDGGKTDFAISFAKFHYGFKNVFWFDGSSPEFEHVWKNGSLEAFLRREQSRSLVPNRLLVIDNIPQGEGEEMGLFLSMSERLSGRGYEVLLTASPASAYRMMKSMSNHFRNAFKLVTGGMIAKRSYPASLVNRNVRAFFEDYPDSTMTRIASLILVLSKGDFNKVAKKVKLHIHERDLALLEICFPFFGVNAEKRTFSMARLDLDQYHEQIYVCLAQEESMKGGTCMARSIALERCEDLRDCAFQSNDLDRVVDIDRLIRYMKESYPCRESERERTRPNRDERRIASSMDMQRRERVIWTSAKSDGCTMRKEAEGPEEEPAESGEAENTDLKDSTTGQSRRPKRGFADNSLHDNRLPESKRCEEFTADGFLEPSSPVGGTPGISTGRWSYAYDGSKHGGAAGVSCEAPPAKKSDAGRKVSIDLSTGPAKPFTGTDGEMLRNDVGHDSRQACATIPRRVVMHDENSRAEAVTVDTDARVIKVSLPLDAGEAKKAAARSSHAARASRENDIAVAESMPKMHVRMFGGFTVELAGSVIKNSSWARRKTKALFVYLALANGNELSRDYLIDQLWPEYENENAKSCFYVALSDLRRLLRENLPMKSSYVKGEKNLYSIDGRRVVTDVAYFERLTYEMTIGQLDNEDLGGFCKKLDETYRGELLGGQTCDDYLETVRERCRNVYIDAMTCGVNRLIEAGNNQQALWFAQRLTERSKMREESMLALMCAQAANGQRSAAIETYMKLKKRLHELYGIEPGKKTNMIFDMIVKEENFRKMIP